MCRIGVSLEVPCMYFYSDDLAYVHAKGFAAFANHVAPYLLGVLQTVPSLMRRVISHFTHLT